MFGLRIDRDLALNLGCSRVEQRFQPDKFPVKGSYRVLKSWKIVLKFAGQFCGPLKILGKWGESRDFFTKRVTNAKLLINVLFSAVQFLADHV